jgi:hypothetical protein
MSVPCEEFALSTTLATVSGAAIKCEEVVETGEDSILPLVWVRAADFEAFDDAVRDDPTVASATLLSEFDDQRLYRMEWTQHIQLVVHMIAVDNAIILNAITEGDQWVLRVLYPNRDDGADVVEFCESHGLSVDVLSIYEMDSEPAGRYGLTNEQYQAVALAHRRGYFDIPRDVSLDELSDELGVSHQALSERLRRGTDALITDTIAYDRFPSGDRDAASTASSNAHR